jgi:hypothetical protein
VRSRSTDPPSDHAGVRHRLKPAGKFLGNATTLSSRSHYKQSSTSSNCFRLNELHALNNVIVLSALAAALAGCVSAGAVVTEPPNSTTSPTNPPVASLAPVATPDSGAPSLVAVSASHPGAEAAAVFATCRIGEFIPINEVAGMAKLPAASDLTHYVPLTGREPLLKEPGPLWVIQIKGDVPQKGGGSPSPGEIWTNPICFVTNSDFGYMGTGPITNTTTGKTTQPEAPAVAPDRKLPPLAP